MNKHKMLNYALITLLALLSTSGWIYASFNIGASVPVTVGGITAANLTLKSTYVGSDCSINGSGTAATCPTLTLTPGQTSVMYMTLFNGGSTSVAITVTPSTGNAAIAQIVAYSTNSALIRPGTSQLYFTITGVGAGSTTISVTITG